MPATAAKLAEKIVEAAKPVVKQQVKEIPKTDIPVNNPFFKVMFDPNLDSAAKVKAVVDLATVCETKEESRALLKELAIFAEYMQDVRTKMSQEIISLQDTDTFSILQTIMEEMNNKVLEFEEDMRPLTEVTEAVYTLRKEGATIDVYKDIMLDKENEKKAKADQEELDRRTKELSDHINSLQIRNAQLGEEKSFFGMGGVTKQARQSIEVNNLALRQSQTELDNLAAEARELEANKHTMEAGQFAAEKAKLRELLDLSKEEHKARQTKLVTSALDFIESSKRDVGKVREHLERMGGSLENLLDNNQKITGVYAILTEGIEDAQKKNKDIAEEKSKIPENERAVQKMEREARKMDVDAHITSLDSAIVKTNKAYTDLTTEAIRVKGMRDANIQSIDDTQTLHTDGIAGIAGRLSTTLQAVSSAALSESSAQAKDTLLHMARITDSIAQKESIRVAMGINIVNKDLENMLENLGEYRTAQETATGIARSGIAAVKENLQKMKDAAAATQQEFKKSFSLITETPIDVAPTVVTTDGKKPNAKIYDPFA